MREMEHENLFISKLANSKMHARSHIAAYPIYITDAVRLCVALRPLVAMQRVRFFAYQLRAEPHDRRQSQHDYPCELLHRSFLGRPNAYTILHLQL